MCFYPKEQTCYNFYMHKQENYEQPNTSTKTLDAKDFLDLIYDGNSLPQDTRMTSGIFKYLDLSELSANNEDKFYSFVKSGEIIVGISELQKNPTEKNTFWIKFISVDPQYQNQGFASTLVEEIFRFAKEQGFSVESSSFSSIGYERLNAKLNETALKYEVPFNNQEKLLPPH